MSKIKDIVMRLEEEGYTMEEITNSQIELGSAWLGKLLFAKTDDEPLNN